MAEAEAALSVIVRRAREVIGLSFIALVAAPIFCRFVERSVAAGALVAVVWGGRDGGVTKQRDHLLRAVHLVVVRLELGLGADEALLEADGVAVVAAGW